jgi:hypothetical protein
MFPLDSPFHNIREICKQSTLLEDHLNHNAKRCPDCIQKHFLSIEAFLDEGVSLSKDPRIASLFDSLTSRFLVLQKAWIQGHNPLEIAGGVRQLRKSLSPYCFPSSNGGQVESLGTLTSDVGLFSPVAGGRNILGDVLIAGLGIYLGYFLIDFLGTGAKK